MPIAWTASDDEGLREMRIQASYDGGRTWHAVVDLPGTASAYAWVLPTSAGVADVELRVTAVDARFQISSDDVGLSFTPGEGVTCQTDLGLGGPGVMTLSVCGAPLSTGNVADLLVAGASPSEPVWLFVSDQFQPTAFFGGQLAPLPALAILVLPTDGNGDLTASIPGGLGPLTLFLQAASPDATLPGKVAISNVLAVEELP